MITFKKDHYFMIDEKLLDKNESLDFIICLEIEMERHETSKYECIDKMRDTSLSDLEHTFWFSSYKRHVQDIEMIGKSIEYLKKKWEL
jgi:hypothetical protein